MNKFAILIVLLLVSATSFARNDVLVGQLTSHFSDCTKDCPYTTKHEATYDGTDFCQYNCTPTYTRDYREEHPLIGYSNGKYTAIVMKNSFDKTSVAVLRNFTYELGPYLRPTFSVGLSTGYSEQYKDLAIGSVIPVGVFSVDIHPENDRFGIIVSVVPTKFVSIGPRFSF